MGFNYLQTDDRDDYFASLSKSRKQKIGQIKYTISKDGIVLLNDFSPKIKSGVKKLLGLTEQFIRHGKWKQIVKEKGYELTEELIKK